MLRAVIFDMDGTLLDSEVIHYIVINGIVKRELGWGQSMEEYLKYCGIPDQKMWPMILEETDSAAVMALAEKWGMTAGDSAGRAPGAPGDAAGTLGQDAAGTSGQDAAGTLGQDAAGTSGQDAAGTSGQDAAGTLGQDAAGTSDRDSENSAAGAHKVPDCAWNIPEQVTADLSAELERLHWAEYDIYIEKNGVTPFPGVRELMLSLREDGIRIAVATGSLVRVVNKNLELLEITDLVEEISTSEDCDNGKPAPDVFLLAAKKLRVEPGDCLVVEDAGNGLLGARRAGMACAGFDGSELPSDMTLAPVVFSDYRKVTPEDFREWYRAQMGQQD